MINFLKNEEGYSTFISNLHQDEMRNFKKKLSVYQKLRNNRYKFLFLLRLSQFLLGVRRKSILLFTLRKIALNRYAAYQDFYNTEIRACMDIGGGLCLPHPTGIILHPSVKIGKNCTILQHVTIGNNAKYINDLSVIGDHVSIGAGAKIIGKCIIGSNVDIGANAVVTKNIKDNQVVAGVPAVVIRTKVDA